MVNQWKTLFPAPRNSVQVTNTIVSMAHAGDRLELERAFSGATVHETTPKEAEEVLSQASICLGPFWG